MGVRTFAFELPARYGLPMLTVEEFHCFFWQVFRIHQTFVDVCGKDCETYFTSTNVGDLGYTDEAVVEVRVYEKLQKLLSSRERDRCFDIVYKDPQLQRYARRSIDERREHLMPFKEEPRRKHLPGEPIEKNLQDCCGSFLIWGMMVEKFHEMVLAHRLDYAREVWKAVESSWYTFRSDMDKVLKRTPTLFLGWELPLGLPAYKSPTFYISSLAEMNNYLGFLITRRSEMSAKYARSFREMTSFVKHEAKEDESLFLPARDGSNWKTFAYDIFEMYKLNCYADELEEKRRSAEECEVVYSGTYVYIVSELVQGPGESGIHVTTTVFADLHKGIAFLRNQYEEECESRTTKPQCEWREDGEEGFPSAMVYGENSAWKGWVARNSVMDIVPR